MSQRSTAQHCHIDTPFCTIRKSHVTWNFAVPGPHSEEIRRCILLFLCTLAGANKCFRIQVHLVRICCWERETKPKLDWKNVFFNMLYYSYDLSGPAYPLVRARYVKMSTASTRLTKRRRRNERDKKKETKDEKGKWRKMHRLIKKTIELFYMDTF